MTTATLKGRAPSVSATLSDISEAVERIKNDQMQHFPEAASIGDAVRQGDVYIQLIDDRSLETIGGFYVPVAAEALQNHLQLAPGNTKGSRHVLQSADDLEMWLPVDNDEAILKAIYAQNNKPWPKNENRNRWTTPFRETLESIEEALALAGPIFRCSKPAVVAHPEHGDWALPPGTYRVIFQRTVDASQRIRRVLD
jgi:hypothetical protein